MSRTCSADFAAETSASDDNLPALELSRHEDPAQGASSPLTSMAVCKVEVSGEPIHKRTHASERLNNDKWQQSLKSSIGTSLTAQRPLHKPQALLNTAHTHIPSTRVAFPQPGPRKEVKYWVSKQTKHMLGD